MNWYVEQFHDKVFRRITWILIIGGILSIPVFTWIDRAYGIFWDILYLWHLNFQGFVYAWVFYFVIFLPACWLFRNIE